MIRPEFGASVEALVGALPLSVDIVDEEGTILYVNDAMRRAVGDRPLGSRCWEVYKDNGRQCRDCPLLRGIEPANPRTTFTEGALGGRIFEIHHVSITYEGRPAVLEIFHDVTEHRQVEEALRRSELEYRRVVDNISDALVIDDLEGRIVYANDRFLELFGFGDSELPSLTIEDFVAPEQRAEVLDTHRRRMRGEDVPRRYDFEGVRKDGSRLRLEVVVVPVHEADRIVGTQATIRDVTERRRAEEALRRSEEKYRRLFETAQEGIWVIDADGHTTDVNPRMAEMLGYAPEEMRGRHLFEFMDADGAEIARRNLERRRSGVREQHDFEFVTREGKRIQTTLVTAPITDERGEYIGAVAGVIDISERKRLEVLLRQSQKMEAIGRLAGGIAHDFNNLLTAILGHSEMLSDELAEGDPRRALVTEIHSAGERAASLTRQLLAFSRQQVLAPTVFSLNEAVRDLERMLRRLIGEDIDLVVELDEELGSVKADRGQIEQVIMNLAVNARDAMPDGGVLTIETANAELDEAYAEAHPPVQPGPYVMLAVSDTGHGIDEETRSRVFDPFFTTKEAGKGTGLGLSTVYGIVKQSGGYVWVYSEPGRGATFKLYLPLVTTASPKHAEGKPPPGAVPTGSETVLLVEDDDAVRHVSRTALLGLGYSVLDARSAEQAVTVCKRLKRRLDLLIVDMVLPGMGGPELAEQVLSVHPGARVLYISGYTDHAIVRSGLLSSREAFLQKPFTPTALGRRVREVLEGRAGEAES